MAPLNLLHLLQQIQREGSSIMQADFEEGLCIGVSVKKSQNLENILHAGSTH